MAKPPRGSTNARRDVLLRPQDRPYTDRWLWEEILGEDPPGPPCPLNEQLVDPWSRSLLRSERSPRLTLTIS